jgi:hypothetical protein
MHASTLALHVYCQNSISLCILIYRFSIQHRGLFSSVLDFIIFHIQTRLQVDKFADLITK